MLSSKSAPRALRYRVTFSTRTSGVLMHRSALAGARQQPAGPPGIPVSRNPPQSGSSTAPHCLPFVSKDRTIPASVWGGRARDGSIRGYCSTFLIYIPSISLLLFQFSILEILWFMQPNFFDLNQLTKAFQDALPLQSVSGSCSRQVQGMDVHLLASCDSRVLCCGYCWGGHSAPLSKNT